MLNVKIRMSKACRNEIFKEGIKGFRPSMESIVVTLTKPHPKALTNRGVYFSLIYDRPNVYDAFIGYDSICKDI